MKIYTKKGDAGETALFGGKRVKKTHPRIEAYGTLDELNAQLGVARSFLKQDLQKSPSLLNLDHQLHRIQSELFSLGAELATPAEQKSPLKNPIAETHVHNLEHSIDEMDQELPPLTQFILPGGSLASAQLHIARTVCRRAERLMVECMTEIELRELCLAYVNRLSDYLFTASRFVNFKSGEKDVLWNP